MRKALSTTMCSILFSIWIAISVSATEYTMLSLGTLPNHGRSLAVAVNNHGQVVGNAYINTNPYTFVTDAFIWDRNTGIQNLGVFPGMSGSSANDINDLGQVVGRSFGLHNESRGFIWDTENGMQGLDTIIGGTVKGASAINNTGQILTRLYDNQGYAQTIVWDPVTGIREIGTLSSPDEWWTRVDPFDMNDSGQVVGSATVSYSVTHAFLWDESNGIRDMGNLSNRQVDRSQASAINNLDQVVGSSYRPYADAAFIWEDSTGMVDLGTIPGLNSSARVACGINDLSQVVGYSWHYGKSTAFIWDSTNGMRAIGVPPGWLQSEANSINNMGIIAGRALCQDGLWYAVLWLPVITAQVEIMPKTLSLKSNGRYVTCYIELPEGNLTVQDIDASSLRLQDTIAPASHQSEIGDYDGDCIPDLMVKFNRSELCEKLTPGKATIKLTGYFSNVVCITGYDDIRINK